MKKNVIYIFVFILLFIYWVYSVGKNCPCPSKNTGKCYRLEFYGIQPNHIYLFILLGYCFPEHFYVLMLLGIIFEAVELYLDIYPDIVYKYIGGCLDKVPEGRTYLIGKGGRPDNIIDSLFGISNSKIHGWNGSILDIITNLVSFMYGAYLNKLKNGINIFIPSIISIILFEQYIERN